MGKKTNLNKHKRVQKDKILFQGTVIESFRSAKFSVRIHTDANVEGASSEIVVLCSLCGKMKENFIKIVPGDVVEVELCEYDMTNGRIITRVRS